MINQDKNRILEPGVDISSWPLLKFLHARELLEQFGKQYKEYRNSLGDETSSEISNAGKNILIKARIIHDFPVQRWSLLFGDIIHNYRSSLDGLAWALAHLDNKKPKPNYLKKIYFPIATSQTRWERLIKNELGSIPEFVLERLRTLQPFLFEETDKAIAVVLNKLSIEDKHKSQLVVKLSSANILPSIIQIQYPRESISTSTNKHIWANGITWLSDGLDVRDGLPICEMVSPAPVEKVIIPELPLSLQTEGQEEHGDVFTLLQTIDTQVSITFQTILNGGPSPEMYDYIISPDSKMGKYVGMKY